MKNKMSIFLLLFIISLIITGCGNEVIKKKRLNLEKYNSKVEFVLKQYELNKNVSIELENYIIDGMLNKKININIPSTTTLEIETVLEVIFNDIHAYINYEVALEEKFESLGSDHLNNISFDINKAKEKYLKQVRENIDCYYFIDGEDGVLEQTFIFDIQDGYKGVFSLYWLEGYCFDIVYRTTGGEL